MEERAKVFENHANFIKQKRTARRAATDSVEVVNFFGLLEHHQLLGQQFVAEREH